MSTLGTRDMSNAVRKRQAIEKAIATAAIDQLLAAGYTLGIYDGEEVTIHHSTAKQALVNALMTTDEDYLLVYSNKEGETSNQIGWVRLVYGNDGYDVICDYSVNIEAHLTNAQAKADEYEGMIYG
jgi:hypothetical protein